MWRRSLLAAAAIAVFVPLLSVSEQPLPAHAEDDWWLDDYDTALAVAAKTGRPLLVEFR